MGGYSAAPASFAAKFARAKLFVHEQNFVVGRLNRVLKISQMAFIALMARLHLTILCKNPFLR